MTKLNMEIGGQSFDIAIKSDDIFHALTKHIMAKYALISALGNIDKIKFKFNEYKSNLVSIDTLVDVCGGHK